MTELKVIKLNEDLKKNGELIFNDIKGNRFFAASLDEKGNYQIHNCGMKSEQIIYMCNAIIHDLLNGELGND